MVDGMAKMDWQQWAGKDRTRVRKDTTTRGMFIALDMP